MNEQESQSAQQGQRDMVYVEESVHGIYKQLTEGGDATTAPFVSMRDLFLLAACEGFRVGERRPLADKRAGIIRWWQFKPQTELSILKAIAVAGNGDASILQEHEQLISAIEEYANAGIRQIDHILLQEDGKQPLWNLVKWLNNHPTV